MATLELEVNIPLDDAAEVLRTEWSTQRIADEFCLYTEEEYGERESTLESQISELEEKIEELEEQLKKHRLVSNI